MPVSLTAQPDCQRGNQQDRVRAAAHENQAPNETARASSKQLTERYQRERPGEQKRKDAEDIGLAEITDRDNCPDYDQRPDHQDL